MRWHAAHAWLPDGPATDVLLVADGGRFTSVTAGVPAPSGAVRLPGLVLPGLADAHSHAFHRALRGRTHDGRGSFWTWRDRMYGLAATLDPDGLLDLATAVFAEAALGGTTTVGEFHYLHHPPGGGRYDDPNATGEALVEAARRAGVRLTLLDTCYLAGGLGPDGHTPPDGVQARFSDGDVDAWAARRAALRPADDLVVGAAVHSVRAVPRRDLAAVAAAAAGGPLHVHLSEQPAENEACVGHYGRTPTALLAAEGVLGPATTAVHATHLTAADVADLGRSGTGVCLCPTTERDLADGIGPARALADAGVALCLGSDSHAVGDPFEEARAVEADERLASRERGRFTVDALVDSLTGVGQAALGWGDAGRLAVGARADLVHVRLDTVRTAGSLPAQAVLAATAADVDTVVVGGTTVVTGGGHRLGDVGALLGTAVGAAWGDR